MTLRVSLVSPWYGATSHLVLGFETAAVGFDEVVVVDDGCDDSTRYELGRAAARNGWVVVENERNLGFAAASNRGYARSSGDIVLFLNSDVRAPIPGLVEAVRCVPDSVIAGPSIAAQVVYGVGFPYIEGWCVAAHRGVWERLVEEGCEGPWDAVSFPHPYWEDNDLSFRAVRAGFKLYGLPWVANKYVSHSGGGTTGPAARYGRWFEENRATFAERVWPTWKEIAAQLGGEQ